MDIKALLIRTDTESYGFAGGSKLPTEAAKRDAVGWNSFDAVLETANAIPGVNLFSAPVTLGVGGYRLAKSFLLGFFGLFGADQYRFEPAKAELKSATKSFISGATSFVPGWGTAVNLALASMDAAQAAAIATTPSEEAKRKAA